MSVVGCSTSLTSSTIHMKEKEDVTMKDEEDDLDDGVNRKSLSSSACTVLHALLEVEGREGLNVLISQARRCGSIHELYRHFQLAVEQDMHSHTCCMDALRAAICEKRREALSKTERRSQGETEGKDGSLYRVKNKASPTCTPDEVSMQTTRTAAAAARRVEVEREEEEENPFLERRNTMDGSLKKDNMTTMVVSHPLCLEHLPLPEPTDMPLKRFKLMQRFPENPSRLEVSLTARLPVNRGVTEIHNKARPREVLFHAPVLFSLLYRWASSASVSTSNGVGFPCQFGCPINYGGVSFVL